MTNKPPEESPWISATQLATLLGVSRASISNAKKSGRFTFINQDGLFHRELAAKEFTDNRKNVYVKAEPAPRLKPVVPFEPVPVDSVEPPAPPPPAPRGGARPGAGKKPHVPAGAIQTDAAGNILGNYTVPAGADPHDAPPEMTVEQTMALLDAAVQEFEEGKAPADGGRMTYTAARAIKEAINAKKEWIKLQEMEGNFLDRHSAVMQIQTICRHNRDAWLNWPQLVAVELAEKLKVDSGILHDVLMMAVKENLDSIATLDIKIDGLDSGISGIAEAT